ncbi:bacteriocin immunity protein [Agrilactobacillus fermenti]|uniref:bacteriocin immunity protein n=1 Tax=Agrilactobacillus fermenti TaxID=2586909 RepID=UPI003A5BAB2B
MKQVKWYAGGNDRSNQAIQLTDTLLTETNEQPALRQVLIKYKTELRQQSTSIPFILSRMNIALSKATQKDSLALSATQSATLKKLTDLANIRYGY